MSISTTMGSPAISKLARRGTWRGGLMGTDYLWAFAFLTPYIAVFLAFVIYPVTYGLWLGSNPASYRALFNDPVYPEAVLNTLIYLGVAVNLKLALALLLSGFFMRKGW